MMPNVSVYISEEIYDKVRDEAKAKRTRVSTLIRELVEQRYGKKKK